MAKKNSELENNNISKKPRKPRSPKKQENVTIQQKHIIDKEPLVIKNIESSIVPFQAEIAAVDVIKSVDKPFVEVGDIVTYTVAMNNTGTVPANNAMLTDIVPN